MKARCCIALASLLGVLGCSESATVATFNIRFFPEPSTDSDAVARAIAETDADVIAIQEILDADAFDQMLQTASEYGDRDYRLVRGPCGGNRNELTTGVVYDASQWTLIEGLRYPDLGRSLACGGWQPATAAVLEKGRRRLLVTSIHFVPFPKRFPERKDQWPKAMELMEDLEGEFEPHASFLMGDTNSTGFRDEPAEEADFVRSTVRDAGRSLLTDPTACTEYWLPPKAKAYRPSMLDHIVTRGGTWEQPQVQGMCERLQCESAPKTSMDPEFESVSDHCPVVVAGKL